MIIGAGPAGLQLGYYLAKEGRDYLIIEAGPTPGTFFKTFPRHRTLISSNKVYTGFDDPGINLRWDWNSLLGDNDAMLFKQYSKRYFPPADDMVRYLSEFATYYDLNIEFEIKVINIARDNDFKLIDSLGNKYSCRVLVIATGFLKPYLPNIPGIELVDVYTEVSTCPEDFVNKKVLIIGKGNSAFETAENLIETAAVIHLASPNPLKMAWKTHFVGHLRATNNNILDTYQLKSQNVIIDASIDKIERRDGKFIVSFRYTHAQGECEDVSYDCVIACTGFRFDDSIFGDDCRPMLAINDRFPAQTSEWEACNVKDLYFAGTLMQMRDYRHTTSGFIHGFRYNILALHRIFEQKYHLQEWPSRQITATPEDIAGIVIKQINKTSALWQQFGFLCDLILIADQNCTARYYEMLPVDYVHDSVFGRHAHYYLITLEFGIISGDPFNIERSPDIAQADQSTFLHPVIRHFNGSTLLAEQHLLEDLDANWSKQTVHVQPLIDFFRRELGQQSAIGSL